MTHSDSIENIKVMAQQLVGDIAQGLDSKDLHAHALDLLLKIVELQNQTPNAPVHLIKEQPHHIANDSEDLIAEEINKVARKLPKWARSQGQINSRILTLYLSLKRNGEEQITEDILSDEYGNISEFYRNYPQLKSISPKNHGKVFDSSRGIIQIWEPVRSLIDEYEKSVFGDIQD